MLPHVEIDMMLFDISPRSSFLVGQRGENKAAQRNNNKDER